MSYLFAAFVAFKVKRSFRAAEWGQTRATRFLSCQDIGYLGACSHSMEILGVLRRGVNADQEVRLNQLRRESNWERILSSST